MFPGQDVQPEKIRERARGAINPITRSPCQIRRTTMTSQGDQGAQPQERKTKNQRKKFWESEKKEVKTKPATKKVWRKKVSSSGTPSGDNNKTIGMESPGPDSKLELSP
jgi:hypothetical protein